MDRSRPTRFAAVAFALLAFTAGTARAAAPAQPPSTPDEWLGLSRSIGQAWQKIQNPQGFYPDYIRGYWVHTRYGEAMLGYAQIMNGLRDHDQSVIDAGVRAVDWAVRVPATKRRMAEGYERSVDGSVFENMAIAASYNLMKDNQPQQRLFAKERTRWGRRLMRVHFKHIGVDPYFNKHAVESVEALEMLNTGVHSPYKGTVLYDRASAENAVRATINVYAYRHAREHLRNLGHGLHGFVLSDPPVNPPAYAGLSYGFYARAVELLGNKADRRAKRTLIEIGNGLWAETAPDGDVAYWGRSQEQAWSDTWTAYGAEMSARVAGPADRGRFEALADRTVRRVIDAYGVRPQGLNIVPALAVDFAGRRELDHYAGGVDYNGNAFVALDWAINARLADRSPTRIGADEIGSYTIGTGKSRFVTVRRPDLWYAIKQTSTRPVRDHRTYVIDLRYDFGLVALKRLAGGKWTDIMAERPYTVWRRTPDSAGPVLVWRGVRYFPYGRHIRVSRYGVVTMDGSFVSARNRLRQRTRFVFRPTARGMRLTFRTRPHSVYEFSRFVPGRGPYGSGINPHLARHDWRVRARGRSLSVSYP